MPISGSYTSLRAARISSSGALAVRRSVSCSSLMDSCLLGRRRPLQTLEQGVPRQRRALHSHRIGANATQRFQVTQVARDGIALEHGSKLLSHLFGAVDGQPDDALAEHARRRLADGAATALESDRLDGAILQPEAEVDLVATERVAGVDRLISRLDRGLVPGVAVVVEDDL